MKKFLLFLLIFSSIFKSYSQVGVGTITPAASAVLDITSTTKGVLVPRMTVVQRGTISPTTAGLLVYQTDGASGFYFHTGSEWKQLANVTATSAQISSLDFNNAKLEPSTYTSTTNYTGVLKIPYAGGNGGTYANGASSIASTGVTGLTATLQGGTLNYGSGELTYNVMGTPSAASPNTATFSIPPTLNASGGSAVVGRGPVLQIGEFVAASYTIPKTTAEQVTFLLSTHVANNSSLPSVPVIDGLQADLNGNGTNFYLPRIRNISGSNLTVSYQTVAPSVNQSKTQLNLLMNNGSAHNVDFDDNVYWTTTNAEVITTNVQVPVGNTYRWYEYKWWAMEVGSNKIIFISIERKL